MRGYAPSVNASRATNPGAQHHSSRAQEILDGLKLKFMEARDGTRTPAHEACAGDPVEPPTMSLFRAADFYQRGYAPRECFAHDSAQHHSPRAQHIYDGLDLMVARDGIEPPTPAFSGLRSTD
jgi:hypothetical protein